MAVSDNDQSVTGQQEVTNGVRVSRDSTHTDNGTVMRPSGTEMNNLVTLDDYLEIRNNYQVQIIKLNNYNNRTLN